jgi:hypothetical protein
VLSRIANRTRLSVQRFQNKKSVRRVLWVTDRDGVGIQIPAQQGRHSERHAAYPKNTRFTAADQSVPGPAL